MGGFEKIDWRGDGELLLEGARYRVDGPGSLPFGEIPTDRFTLRKTRRMIELYERFYEENAFRPTRIFELGLYDGASVAFWHDVLEPETIVGIDLRERGDSPYFERWAEERGRSERVRTRWGVDQRDKEALRRIAATEFGEQPLDLVIDDCSHVYGPTKASFEALFPLVRNGGWYVIEDWAWEGSSAYGPGSGAALEDEAGLIELVRELVSAAGSPERELVRSISVNETFAAIERGPATVFRPDRFSLEDFVGRGPARQDRSFVFSTVAACSPEEAFAAWTDEPSVRRWWDWDASADVLARADARLGGRYEITVSSDDRWERAAGEYLELEVPHRIKLTLELSLSQDWFARAVVTVLFRPHDEGTQVIAGFMNTEFRATLVPAWWERSWEGRLSRFASIAAQSVASEPA